MRRILLPALGVATALSFGPQRVNAQTTRPGEPPHVLSDVGLGVSVGGGVTGFTDGDARDVGDTGGTWEARMIFGTRQLLAAEAAYIGSAQDMDAIGLDNDAFLVGNGLEALARLNFMPNALQPYIFAGAAWRHYDVTNSSVNTSNVEEGDNVVEIPLGVGLSYRWNGLMLDARASFRPAIDSELVDASFDADDANLSTWNLGAVLGWEF